MKADVRDNDNSAQSEKNEVKENSVVESGTFIDRIIMKLEAWYNDDDDSCDNQETSCISEGKKTTTFELLKILFMFIILVAIVIFMINLDYEKEWTRFVMRWKKIYGFMPLWVNF